MVEDYVSPDEEDFEELEYVPSSEEEDNVVETEEATDVTMRNDESEAVEEEEEAEEAAAEEEEDVEVLEPPKGEAQSLSLKIPSRMIIL